MSSLRNKVVQSSPINKDKILIGNTTRCIDSSCTGWYTDSFIGKYWIQCLDSKHSMKNGENGVLETTPTTIPTTRIQEPPQPEDHNLQNVSRIKIGILEYD